MSQAPIMPFSTDAFLADTLHLTTEQIGAYMMILLATWRNNGIALPDDDHRMARIVRTTPARWTHHLRPALEAFFTIDATGWHQKKLEKTWRKIQESQEKNRENGKQGAKARWLKNKKTDMATAKVSPSNQNGEAIVSPMATISSKKELSAPYRAERVLSYDGTTAREGPASAQSAPAPRRATASKTKSPADEARELIARGLNPITGQPVDKPQDGPPDLDEEIPA